MFKCWQTRVLEQVAQLNVELDQQLLQGIKYFKMVHKCEVSSKALQCVYHHLNFVYCYFIFIIVVQLQFSGLFPHRSPLRLPSPLSQSIPLPLSLPMSLYSCSFACPFSFFSPLLSSPVPSGQCQFVLYLRVSGSILLICLFY